MIYDGDEWEEIARSLQDTGTMEDEMLICIPDFFNQSFLNFQVDIFRLEK